LCSIIASGVPDCTRDLSSSTPLAGASTVTSTSELANLLAWGSAMRRTPSRARLLGVLRVSSG
jgi:hypothetical protein